MAFLINEYKNIWLIQKKVVPLHSLNKNNNNINLKQQL